MQCRAAPRLGRRASTTRFPSEDCGNDKVSVRNDKQEKKLCCTLKVLSLLLSYPEAETLAALDEMAAVIEQEKLLPEDHKKPVLALINSYRGADLLDLQEHYVALFDRGRFLSLHIFEHVHGESRDRGQAMVNLLQMYESHGFEMSTHELPDYIPLFLEFLSQQEPAEAVKLLQDAMPVLSLLGARLAERGSEFRVIFDALEGLPVNLKGLTKFVNKPPLKPG